MAYLKVIMFLSLNLRMVNFSLIFVVYILVIEHLPQELRDRFTEMREMDLGVQSMYSIFDNTDSSDIRNSSN